MKLTKFIPLLTFCSLAFVSCGILSSSDFGSTTFSNDDISLGDSKAAIIKKYGEPYTQNLEYVDGKRVETIGYKEKMYYGYSVNTFFMFEDGKLVRKWQTEDKPNSTIIKKDDD